MPWNPVDRDGLADEHIGYRYIMRDLDVVPKLARSTTMTCSVCVLRPSSNSACRVPELFARPSSEPVSVFTPEVESTARVACAGRLDVGADVGGEGGEVTADLSELAEPLERTRWETPLLTVQSSMTWRVQSGWRLCCG